jgi:hypothetical protein
MVNKPSPLVNSSPVVEEYVSKLPDKIRAPIELLRKIILSASAQIEERLKHNIPFYFYKGQLCYINFSDENIILGFSRGADMPDEKKLLKGQGKSIRHAVIDPVKDINEDVIRHLIYEALIVNEMKAGKA